MPPRVCGAATQLLNKPPAAGDDDDEDLMTFDADEAPS